MNASFVIIALVVLGLAASEPQTSHGSVATAATGQRILVGGVAPPEVPISPVQIRTPEIPPPPSRARRCSTS